MTHWHLSTVTEPCLNGTHTKFSLSVPGGGVTYSGTGNVNCQKVVGDTVLCDLYGSPDPLYDAYRFHWLRGYVYVGTGDSLQRMLGKLAIEALTIRSGARTASARLNTNNHQLVAQNETAS